MMIRVKIDIYDRHLIEIRKLWKNEDEMRRNPIVLETGLGDIEIYPICYKGQGCQGNIVVKKNGKTVVEANLKRGTIIWFLGDKVRKNDIATFIDWANYVIWITSIIKPVIDILPTEHYMKRKWEVEITLFTPQYKLPDFAENIPAEKLALRLR